MRTSTELRPYFHRRLYGICWTCVYYCVPAYHLLLSIPPLKTGLFRLFGYRGSMAFTTYPDTWIRDLPLLDFGPDVYLSNRATIGTNVILLNRDIVVDRISLGARTLVGHLTMLAPGVRCGEDVEIGVGCAIGFGVVLEDRVKVEPSVTIDHGCRVGAGAQIGNRSYIGKKSVIGPGLKIPPGTVIPSGTQLAGEGDLRRLLAPFASDGGAGRE